MGHMKDLLITIYNGGDDAVAAVERRGQDWREQLEQAAAEIERLRLTDAEREAVRSACGSVKMVGTEKCFTTLLGLLERLA